MGKRSIIHRDVKHKFGHRPPKQLIIRCAKAGLTNEQTAAVCGVSRKTLQVWLSQDPKLAQAFHKATRHPNLLVENSLFRRALGYNVVETEEKVVTNGNGEIIKKIPVVRRHKHIPASVKAIEDWLYNRDGERWKRQATLNVRNMSLKDKTELANSGLFDGEDDELELLRGY